MFHNCRLQVIPELHGPVRRRDVIGLQDWLNARAARRMARKQRFPETIERSYWRSADYTKDSTRLEAMGYTVESEADNAPYE